MTTMQPHTLTSDLEWARRVNQSWIVRSNLNDHADAWLDYLAEVNDGRLAKSCSTARAMCGLRNFYDDPKPWFYAGLFSLATAAEAKRYLDTHRITKASVPAMIDDEGVNLWIDRVGPDTSELLDRLRAGVTKILSSQ